MVSNIDNVLKEWQSKKRIRGCVSATNWFCKRVKEFYPERINRYTKQGELFLHVVATNGVIRIDLSPYADKPK